MLSNMHTTTICAVLLVCRSHLLASWALKSREHSALNAFERVFHGKRKLKYLFIHFRYISLLQLCFLLCSLLRFYARNAHAALELGKIMHSLPTVAKRASSTWFHTFEDGDSLQLRTGNGYRAGDEDLRFTFSCIMQSVRRENRDNPSAFQMYSRTENGSRNFSSPPLAPLNVILSYFHLFYSLCLILFLRSPFHIILREICLKISTQSFFTAYETRSWLYPSPRQPNTHIFHSHRLPSSTLATLCRALM